MKRLALLILISLLLIVSPVYAALPACPAAGNAMSVIGGWLVNNVQSVRITHFGTGRRPYTTTNQYFISGARNRSGANVRYSLNLLHLTGANVPWNGYASPSPFGDFYYPYNGTWKEEYEVRSGLYTYQIWFWRSTQHETNNYLVFTFIDLIYTTDMNGQHYGEHNFCRFSVPVRAVQQMESIIQPYF